MGMKKKIRNTRKEGRKEGNKVLSERMCGRRVTNQEAYHERRKKGTRRRMKKEGIRRGKNRRK